MSRSRRATSPLVLSRSDAEGKLSDDDKGGTTYKKLWDAATGSGEKLNILSVRSKIDQMECELALLRMKEARMTQTKRQLLGELNGELNTFAP